MKPEPLALVTVTLFVVVFAVMGETGNRVVAALGCVAVVVSACLWMRAWSRWVTRRDSVEEFTRAREALNRSREWAP